MARERYRSKLEVFRDLLVATRHASKKTRIIGLANLNPSTFKRHMAIARAGGLVTLSDSEYRLTDKADHVLAALQELMAKSNEVDITMQSLGRSGLAPASTRWVEGAVLRQVSRVAWSEFEAANNAPRTSFARSGGMSSMPAGFSRQKPDISDIISSLPFGGRTPVPRESRRRRVSVPGPSDKDTESRGPRRSRE